MRIPALMAEKPLPPEEGSLLDEEPEKGFLDDEEDEEEDEDEDTDDDDFDDDDDDE